MATFTDEKADENSDDHEFETAMDKLHSCSYDNDEVKEWYGIPLFRNIFYIYLYHKYKQPCVAVGEKGVALVICDAHQDYPEIIEECVLNVQNNKNIIEKIRECIDKDNVETLLIPVSLYFLHRGKIGRHANLLLYRKFNKTIEVFEPNGQMTFPNNFVAFKYNLICKNINNKLPRNKQVRLVHNTQICPNVPGLQYMQSRSNLITDKERGYCLAWSMYFAELVLKNPTKTSEQILQNIHKRLANLRVGENGNKKATYKDGSNYLMRLIRGYVFYISEIIGNAMSVFIEPGMTYDNYIAFCKKNEDERGLRKTISTFEKDYLKINMNLFENGQEIVLDNLKKENPRQYQMYEEYITQYLQPFSQAKSDLKEGSTSSSSSSSLLQKRNNDDMNDDDTTDNKKARPDPDSDPNPQLGPGPGPGPGGGYGRRRLKKTKTKKTKKKKTKKKKTKTKKTKTKKKKTKRCKV